MELQTAIKKAEKVSGTKINKDTHGQYSVAYKGYTLSFFVNGRLDENGKGEITCIYTIRDGMKDNFQEDYHAGTYHDNLTQGFKFIDRQSKDALAEQGKIYELDGKFYFCKKAPYTFSEVDAQGNEVLEKITSTHSTSTAIIVARQSELKLVK